MSKAKKSATRTAASHKGPGEKQVISRRKNTSGDTRNSNRQRSGNNGPQQGSH